MKTYTIETLETVEVYHRTYTVTAEHEKHAKERYQEGARILESESLNPCNKVQFIYIREKI
jgi:hypothetical protein